MQIITFGKIVKDFEESTSRQGKVIWKLGICTSIGDKVKEIASSDKEKEEGKFSHYYWINAFFFHDAYLKLSPYLHKGKWVLVYGQLRLYPYMSREREPKTAINVYVDRIELSPGGPREERENFVPRKSNEEIKKYNEEAPSVHQFYPREKINEEICTADPFFVRREDLSTTDFNTTDFSNKVYYGCESGSGQQQEKEDAEEKNQEDYLFEDIPF